MPFVGRLPQRPSHFANIITLWYPHGTLSVNPATISKWNIFRPVEKNQNRRKDDSEPYVAACQCAFKKDMVGPIG
ncbi:hypothetical protein GGQ65_006773 [Rhizobium fabae]|jgi:hypothetical protein|uniref:Uncharacterized protein n=1 Tax=Rhizobium fabae TaxID=573179 RepID=A0A7W6FME1_9HYPH|nr:hypothetical protein [Rhizobium fabae]MBB3919428.1 hypothetical protein [Rhizobium fabae]